MSSVKKNGIVNGVMISLIYIGVIYILSSVIEGDFSLNLKSIIMIIGAVIAGAVGGIIGVNRRWNVIIIRIREIIFKSVGARFLPQGHVLSVAHFISHS